MSHERFHAIEQFLYKEARLLDDRRFNDWLELLTDDISYTMPTRYNRLRAGPDEQWEVERELDELCYFEETKASLTQRVQRFFSGMAWAEEPPSRTRHLITNIEVLDGDSPEEAVVYSSFLTYRSRLEGQKGDEDSFVGRREDVLRRVNGEWKVAKRRIIIDAVVINAQNLSIFF